MRGQIPTEEIKRISIDGFGGDIRILPSEGNELVYDIGEGLEIQHEIRDNSLFLKIRSKGILGIPFFNFGGTTGYINLYIPKDKSLELNLKSGDIAFTDYRGEDILLKAASGDIDIERLFCNSFQAHLTSGDIDIDMETKKGSLNFRSGDVKILLRGDDWDVDISGVSGDVDLDTESSSVELYIKGISGDVSVNNESIATGKIGSKHLVTDGGRNKLRVNVISGDISVKTGEGTGEIKIVQQEKTNRLENQISTSIENDTNIFYIPEEVKKVRDMYRIGKLSREDAMSLLDAMGYGGLSNILEE